MFDIGFSELLVVFVVMLLVVGPERLPIVARKIGLYLGKMRRSFQQVKAEVEQELEIEAVKAQLKDNAMKKEAELLQKELNKDVEDAFMPSQSASDEFEDDGDDESSESEEVPEVVTGAESKADTLYNKSVSDKPTSKTR